MTLSGTTRTLGIDLASQPKNTAACVIEWAADGRGRVVDAVAGPLDDAALLGLMRDEAVTKIAIDAPLGWPLEFIDAVTAYRDAGEWPVEDPSRLTLRETDLVVKRLTGQNPLSVTSSLIAWPAMRCARLLSELAAGSGPIDRSGGGRVAEVYPAAALRSWSLSPALWEDDPGGYKGKDPGSATRRARLAGDLVLALDGSVSVDQTTQAAWGRSDDELDAFVCSIIARAIEVGRTQPIPEALQARARQEGWIHLPLDEPLTAAIRST